MSEPKPINESNDYVAYSDEEMGYYGEGGFDDDMIPDAVQRLASLGGYDPSELRFMM